MDNPVSFLSPDKRVSLESWLDTSSVGVAGMSLVLESEYAMPMDTSDGEEVPLLVVEGGGPSTTQTEDTLDAGVMVNNGFVVVVVVDAILEGSIVRRDET